MNGKEFNDVEKLLDTLSNYAEELPSKKSIPLQELFTEDFMKTYTPFSSFPEFLLAGGFHGATQEELDTIPETELDAYVCAKTDFHSWNDMLEKASEVYTERDLGI